VSDTEMPRTLLSAGMRQATTNKWPKTRSAKFEAKNLEGEGLLAGTEAVA